MCHAGKTFSKVVDPRADLRTFHKNPLEPSEPFTTQPSQVSCPLELEILRGHAFQLPMLRIDAVILFSELRLK